MGGGKDAPTMTILLVLDIYEKSRSFKSIHTCVFEQAPNLLGGWGSEALSTLPGNNSDKYQDI